MTWRKGAPAYGHWPAVWQLRHYLHTLPDMLDYRCPDEHCTKGWAIDLIDLQIGFEAVHLPAERITGHIYIHQVQRFWPVVGKSIRDDDHAGAGPPHRHAGTHFLFECISEAVYVDELNDGSALAARDNEPVNLV